MKMNYGKGSKGMSGHKAGGFDPFSEARSSKMVKAAPTSKPAYKGKK